MSPTLDFRKEPMKMCHERKKRAFRLLVSALVLAVPTACGTKESPAPAAPKALVLPATAYRAELTPQNPPKAGAAGSKATMTVNVKNLSETTWPENREGFAIGLTYHWRDRKGNIVIFDGVRTALSVSLAPGKAVPIQAAILFPPKPGDYVLELDMVQDYVTWFAEKGSLTTRVDVRVD